jgi:predicted membrane chloride channel (bestrophin family)
VEELFIWKISDEMKLSVPDEKAFSDFIRKMNQKKSECNDDIQNVLKKLSEAKDLKEKEKLLKEHRKALKVYNDLTLEEVDQMQKIFGSEKAAQYFVLKNDLTNKLKSMLASPEKAAKTPLPPPRIIEEK